MRILRGSKGNNFKWEAFFNMKLSTYFGPGNHSVNTLEAMVKERDEKIYQDQLLIQDVNKLLNNLMAKGNVNWGSTFGIDFGLMNEVLLRLTERNLK